ncbi:MAG: outer membrane lipoprotein-sorting protein [Acidobacteriota bacterium]
MKRFLILVAVIFWGVLAFSQEMKFGIRVSQDNLQSVKELLAKNPSEKGNSLFLTIELDENWEKEDLSLLRETAKEASLNNYLVNVIVPLPQGTGEERLISLVSLSENLKGVANSFELKAKKEDFSEEEIANPEKLAFSLKRISVSLRGESLAKIYLGPVDTDYLNLIEPLYKEDLIAYIDGYFTYDVDSSGEPDSQVSDFLQKNHLGAPLRLHLKKVRTALGAQSNSMSSLAKGAKEVDMEIENIEEGLKGLSYLRRSLPKTMSAGFDVSGVQVKEGEKTRFDIALLPFLDSEEMVQAFYLAPTVAKSNPASVVLHLSTADITNPVSFPMPEGEARKLGYTADEKKGICDIQIAWDGKPQLVLFERLKTGTVGTDEKIVVQGTYKIPVEFIIARHQAVEQSQSLLLSNYTADAEVDYHFKVPGTTGSVDVTFLNQFLYDPKAGARWVQKDLLVNGVKWKGKTIPELPIIEPEKINTLPLVLTLTRAYTYRLIKEEEFRGRMCYVIEFLPSPGQKVQDVSGKVWIDKENYLKRQIQIIQKNMTPPQVSNEEFDLYQIYEENGKGYNILSEIKAQQIFTVIGQTVTAEKEVYFRNIKINDEKFSEKVDEAFKSDAPILQDTEKGYRYLEKNPDGTRSVRWEEKTGRWAALGGAYYDESLDSPLPFIGANYFDYDYKKTKSQVNLFLAGAVNSFSFSKPDVFPKFDFAVSGVFFLVSFKDRYFEEGIEQKNQELKTLKQHIFTSLGYRTTQFSKIRFTLDGSFIKFKETKKTDDYFKTPKDHFDIAYGLSYDYSRQGWQTAASFEGHKRSSWENWGFGFTDSEINKNKDYLTWDLTFGKTFYLKNFQKVGVSLSYLDGKDLDRFSKYQFTYMGAKSLSGFTGSGIRFEKGYITRVLYSFDVAKIIRFSSNIDYAKIKQNKDDLNWQNHTGFGFSGTIAGPWNTIWSLDLGYALNSDIPKVKHDYTAALVVLKLWGR